MKKINKPVELPDCKIIQALIDKSNEKLDYEFDYIHQLNEIRNRVSIEVSRINLLFPEYTPHDERYHLKRLFYVADHLLGDQLIKSMNVTELFLLSVSLYAHDWGMAISDEEKDFILSGCEGKMLQDYNLLDDEKIRVEEFFKNKNTKASSAELSDWQEYVRVTHAFRSGKRIKAYFDKISVGVADFTARICEGHWLDFDVIDDYTSYPTDASIHRDIVNVKALTIYVRMIDLLDLGEDRTPFVLWKFVSPRNNFSKIEWAKHRALQPVTFPQYQLARYVQVDGSTDNQDVYMSIMDLKRYVDNQFRQCFDILNRINHDYHKLDISHIDWRIAARNFEPVAIQFEFDRNRMFDMLSDDIYQGDPYVFVRELVQNAIDAIEMRVEILDKKGLSFKPTIIVNVVEKDEFYIVSISDNGVGMDEYIVRNYLAVAGKSYYRSVDFRKEGLIMDPISRFGIGVLSCFMMSDYIEIETYKDPNTTQKHESLKISIPAKANYFKINKNASITNIGSTFNVYVIKSRLPLSTKRDKPITLNITEYLRYIAGFVKFPITVCENGQKSIIVDPDSNLINEENSNFFRISYEYQIEEAIAPQNIQTAKEYFFEKQFHLKRDLGLASFNGCLTFLLPKSESIDIVNNDGSWPCTDVTLLDYKSQLCSEKRIQWNMIWNSYGAINHRNYMDNIPSMPFSVFMDGIKIEKISAPHMKLNDHYSSGNSRLRKFFSYCDTFVIPQLIVNIPKFDGLKIDLARTNITTREKWDNEIWIAFFKHLKNTLLVEIEGNEPKIRLLKLAKLITFYKLTEDIVINRLITVSKFPLPFISEKGKIIFCEFDKAEFEIIRISPKEVRQECFRLLSSAFIDFQDYKGILSLKRGKRSVLNLSEDHNFRVPASLKNIRNLVKYFINKFYYLDSLEFILSPINEKESLFAQEVFKLKTEDKLELSNFDIKEIVRIGLDKLDTYSIHLVNELLKFKFNRLPRIIKFPEKQKGVFAYSIEYLNWDYIVSRNIVIICLSLILLEESNTKPKEIVGKISDMIYSLEFCSFDYSDTEVKLDQMNNKINILFAEAIKNGILEPEYDSFSNIGLDNFIGNCIEKKSETNSLKILDNEKQHFNEGKKW